MGCNCRKWSGTTDEPVKGQNPQANPEPAKTSGTSAVVVLGLLGAATIALFSRKKK